MNAVHQEDWLRDEGHPYRFVDAERLIADFFDGIARIPEGADA